MKRFRRVATTVAAACAASGLVAPAAAGPVAFDAAPGSLSAPATPAVVGSDQQLVVARTETRDETVPAVVLTGISLASTDHPAPAAATSSGSGHDSPATDPPTPASATGTDSAGAWAFAQATAARGARFGHDAAGFSVFRAPAVFPGPNADDDPEVDDTDYGLLPTADLLQAGSGGLDGRILAERPDTLLPARMSLQNFDAFSSIHDLTFPYGMALATSSMPGIANGEAAPSNFLDPGTLALLGLGALAFGASGRTRRG